VLGQNDPSTLRTRAEIAHWSGEAGDAREALRLFEEVLPIQEQVLGPDHPDVATCLENYGLLLRNMGRPDEAAPLEFRARAIRIRTKHT
jgi:tetratricopeptide repeat protein